MIISLIKTKLSPLLKIYIFSLKIVKIVNPYRYCISDNIYLKNKQFSI